MAGWIALLGRNRMQDCCAGLGMDSGPLVHTNGQMIREVQAPYPVEFSRQLLTGVYPNAPAQDSTLREYLLVLIKRKWTVLFGLVGAFIMVAVSSLKMTPID